MFVSVSKSYTDTKGLRHTSAAEKIMKSKLNSMVENLAQVKMDGVNNVIIDMGTRRIIQAGGYTVDRGLFCDMY